MTLFIYIQFFVWEICNRMVLNKSIFMIAKVFASVNQK